ncbi:hypothetical protein [Chlorobium phaeobacteroides]|nr:hypothetical protein [Chlorobium phaeobacteroides]
MSSELGETTEERSLPMVEMTRGGGMAKWLDGWMAGWLDSWIAG